MKMKKSIFVLSAILLLTSCSKEENNNNFEMKIAGEITTEKTNKVHKWIAGSNIRLTVLANQKNNTYDSSGVYFSGSTNKKFYIGHVFYFNGIERVEPIVGYELTGTLTLNNDKIFGELIGPNGDYVRVNNF
jgi:hypothetical protein